MNTDCNNCSKCCRNFFLPIKNFSDDVKRWIEFHGISVVRIKDQDYLKINNPCENLKDDKCSIYEDRPDVCRVYDCKDNQEFL